MVLSMYWRLDFCPLVAVVSTELSSTAWQFRPHVRLATPTVLSDPEQTRAAAIRVILFHAVPADALSSMFAYKICN